MKLKVKLFSVLQDYAPQYDQENGLVVELSSGARVKDLILHLEIPGEKAPVVTCNGRVLKADDRLHDGSMLHLFQPVAGG